MHKAIKLFWHGGQHDLGNFGDALSQLIVEHVSGRPARFVKRHACEMIAIGSILEGVQEKGALRRALLDFSPIVVWGSGFIQDGGPIDGKLFDFRSVRGPNTRRRVDPTERLPLGDPGLLAADLLAERPEKKWRWGVIPHVSHAAEPFFDQIVDRTEGAVKIQLRGDPLAILRRIAECERVVTTSLHGLVASDSLGIPNDRIVLGSRLRGGNWKFLDYYQSLGRQERFFAAEAFSGDLNKDLRSIDAHFDYGDRIEALKADIYAAFPQELKAAAAGGGAPADARRAGADAVR